MVVPNGISTSEDTLDSCGKNVTPNSSQVEVEEKKPEIIVKEKKEVKRSKSWGRRSTRTKKNISYRFDEFDEAIEEAIEEDIKEAEGGGAGRGKDMANITGHRGKDISTILQAEEGQENGVLPRPSAGQRRKKRRRLNDLDSDSTVDEEESEEEFRLSERNSEWELAAGLWCTEFSGSSSSILKVPGSSMFTSVKAFEGQQYSTLKRQCLQSGLLFEDPRFPAIDHSLFYQGNRIGRVVWKRPRDLEVHTSAALGCIHHCGHMVPADRHVQVAPTQKPWMHKEIQQHRPHPRGSLLPVREGRTHQSRPSQGCVLRPLPYTPYTPYTQTSTPPPGQHHHQEIIDEVKKELHKMKEEIISTLIQELKITKTKVEDC
ncbi:unnamed protein product [Menidia menidia]|uniref:(Atlantic silverside) hypothetical protein n=1 Tax=Menidia menidia TaxID=238744 RepID=A0A8S4AM99_9TELE|nr:unnamed protein product [Menidia menidia]